MSINFNQFFNTLLSGAESIAKSSLQDYESQAKADGQQAIQDIKTDLQRWTQEMETGVLSAEDLKDLLLEDDDLIKMTALKQAGLAAVHIDEFRNSIINMIVGTVMGLIKV